MQITADEDCKIFIYWQERTWDFVFFPQFREIVCCFCPPVRCPEAEPGAACMGGVGFIHAEAGAVIPSENYLTLKERERLTPGETQPWHSAGQQ